MTNAKDWVCGECGPITSVCEHLESLLPGMQDGEIRRLISTEAVANITTDVFQAHFWKQDEGKFLELMRNYGITEEWDLDLLSAKYYRNLSPDDIVQEFHWVGRDKVYGRLKALQALLVERGIEQELR